MQWDIVLLCSAVRLLKRVQPHWTLTSSVIMQDTNTNQTYVNELLDTLKAAVTLDYDDYAVSATPAILCIAKAACMCGTCHACVSTDLVSW